MIRLGGRCAKLRISPLTVSSCLTNQTKSSSAVFLVSSSPLFQQRAKSSTSSNITAELHLSRNAAESHYTSHTNESYESSFFAEPGPYLDYLQQLIQNRLQLLSPPQNENVATPEQKSPSTLHTILDVGGGTGNFTRLILENTTNTRAVLIDPYFVHDETSTSNDNDPPEYSNVSFVQEYAETAFGPTTKGAEWRQNYQQVLIKESIHHIEDPNDRIELFSNIAQDFRQQQQQDQQTIASKNKNSITSKAPQLLITTRQKYDIDYPLWREAKDVWVQHQPSHDEIEQELISAGFDADSITTTMETYSCKIPLAKWQAMVKGRVWSTFSYFSDEELQQACDEKIPNEFAHQIDKDNYFHFEDRLYFISAVI